MLKYMIVFMMIFMNLEAEPLPIFKTGQTQSYSADGNTIITDDSIKDDGYYQTGVRQRYTRDDTTEIVTDEVTRLKWQDDATVSDDTNKSEWEDALIQCTDLRLGGHNDWRLPSREELESIVNRGKSDPAISSDFVNIISYHYWSSTPAASGNNRAWNVNFDHGYSTNSSAYGANCYVRCVRGTEFDNLNLSRNDATEIVTDSITNLQWQDNSDTKTTEKTWTGAIEYCEALDMAGQTDWRLPNQNELLSIVDISSYNPAINGEFDNVISLDYWSSTTTIEETARAWGIEFEKGRSNYYVRLSSDSNYVRCVRGGQLDNFKLKTLTKTGQTKSYDASGSEVTNGSIKDDGYYQAGFKRAYTRDDITEIVTDNTTKLEWQDNSIAKTDESNWAEANSYCSTLNLHGVKGWRLPSRGELESIVNRGVSNPSLSEKFNNFSSSSYWSSTAYADNTSHALNVSFISGHTIIDNKILDYHFRCVRSGEFDNLNFSRDNTEKIVTDRITNLQWQDDADVNDAGNKKNWTEAIEYCETLTLASQTDWRLPNANELLSIVDSSSYNPAINSEFINVSPSYYWSSTSRANDTSHAIDVSFLNTGVLSLYSVKSDENRYTRCVRGGDKTTMAPIIMYLLN